MSDVEYSASEIRKLLQALFPHRRLVLSQFTFFNQIGIARPTGTSFRRGRRCYRLEDLLSIACILALKEEGIPFKNVEALPSLLQEHAANIFAIGEGCRLSGYGEHISLNIPGVLETSPNTALDAFLADEGQSLLFWGFDVGLLAGQLQAIAANLTITRVAQAA